MKRHYQHGPWPDFERQLDSYERSIGNLRYSPAAEASDHDFLDWAWEVPKGALTIEQVTSPLDVKPPYGYGLLNPAPIPTFPIFPQAPPLEHQHGVFGGFFRPKPKPGELTAQEKQRILERADKLRHRGEALQQQFEAQFQKEAKRLAAIHDACVEHDVASIKLLISISHLRHWLPVPLRHPLEVDIDTNARIILCTIEIPDFQLLGIVKKRGGSSRANWLPVSASQKKRASEDILYSLCLRSAYLIAKSDEGYWFDTIAVNARQSWDDRATGLPRTGIIASLQATRDQIADLRLDQVDPKICFRHLKGISTPSVEDISPIRPIFVLDKNDNRIVQGRDVAQKLEPEENLAAMPWEDFEHLVRQLFEWEFGQDGVEVRVTRASRDRGVDAIIYDPDPLRGGKFVVQAKRYTRPVDVASVRDLYGTVLNEGANRGILVTTSSYGPDAYEFAKDKPLSLVDGPNLIAMLRRHGRRYTIDIEEARRLAGLSGSDF